VGDADFYAELIVANPVMAPTVVVPNSTATVGGYAFDLSEQSTSDSVMSPTDEKSFERLLADMEQSINDVEIVTECSKDAGWESVLKSLTPLQFGKLISKVCIEFRQTLWTSTIEMMYL